MANIVGLAKMTGKILAYQAVGCGKCARMERG